MRILPFKRFLNLLLCKCMNLKSIILMLADLAIWYLFILYWLYCIKNPVFLPVSSGALLLLAVLGMILFLFFHKSDTCRKTWYDGEVKNKKDAAKK